jgi:hypothetical protein
METQTNQPTGYVVGQNKTNQLMRKRKYEK